MISTLTGDIQYEITSEETAIIYVKLFQNNTLFEQKKREREKNAMLALLIDKSGSMDGDCSGSARPIDIVKQNCIVLAREYYKNRETQNQPVNLLTLAFDGSSTEIKEASFDRYQAAVSAIDAFGGTNFSDPLN